MPYKKQWRSPFVASVKLAVPCCWLPNEDNIMAVVWPIARFLLAHNIFFFFAPLEKVVWHTSPLLTHNMEAIRADDNNQDTNNPDLLYLQRWWRALLDQCFERGMLPVELHESFLVLVDACCSAGYQVGLLKPLLQDLKADGERSYEEMRELLAPYVLRAMQGQHLLLAPGVTSTSSSSLSNEPHSNTKKKNQKRRRRRKLQKQQQRNPGSREASL